MPLYCKCSPRGFPPQSTLVEANVTLEMWYLLPHDGVQWHLQESEASLASLLSPKPHSSKKGDTFMRRALQEVFSRRQVRQESPRALWQIAG